MKIQLFKLIAITILVSSSASAQNGTVAAGVKASGSGGSVSYSVGPIIFKKPDGQSITNGLQQPYEIILLDSFSPDANKVVLSCYPNPTNSYLHLLLQSTNNINFTYEVVSLDGKQVIANQKVNSNETVVDLASSPAGIYILQVASGTQKIKSFKIIKH